MAERQRRWHLKLDRLTQRLSAGSVCVSEGVRRFSVETGRLDPDRLVVIPNGVDPSPFDETNPIDRESLGLPGSGPLALYVGRLDPQKGLGDLIEAARRVAIARPDWHLLMVGDGPERTQRQEQAATHPELAGRIHWLGRRPDIPALLKTANFLVLPSLWEGMPNVVLEAMAAGRAVVGTRVEGTEELVVPGKTGWLVPPAAPEALAAALLEASTDQDRLRRMGEAARRRVEEHYTPGRVVAAYDRLWAGLLGLSFVGAD